MQGDCCSNPGVQQGDKMLPWNNLVGRGCHVQVKLTLRLPARADVESLARIFGPASFTYFCKNLCYLMMQVGLLPQLAWLCCLGMSECWGFWGARTQKG